MLTLHGDRCTAMHLSSKQQVFVVCMEIVARNRPENSMFRQVGNLRTTLYSEGLLFLRFVIPNRAQGLLFQKPKLWIGLGFVIMNLVLYSE